MNDVVKMAGLDLRVILPYRRQALILLAIAPVLALQTMEKIALYSEQAVQTGALNAL